MCVFVSVYAHDCSVHGDENSVLHPMELKLQAVWSCLTWILRKLWPTARTVFTYPLTHLSGPHFVFWERVSHWTCSSPVWLDWLTRKPQRASCDHSPELAVQVCPAVPGDLSRGSDLRSSCIYTLATEPSLQPGRYGSLRTVLTLSSWTVTSTIEVLSWFVGMKMKVP